MIAILKTQLSILKDKGEKPLILYFFTISRPPQLFRIKWIRFGPVTKKNLQKMSRLFLRKKSIENNRQIILSGCMTDDDFVSCAQH